MARYAKGVIAVIAFALALLNAGVVPDHIAVWVHAVIAAIGAALVILVPNAELPEGAVPKHTQMER